MRAYPRPLLSSEDVAELTGYEQPAAQRRWLKDHQYPHDVRRDGTVVITWAAVDETLIGGGTKIAGPNLDALRRAG